MSSEVDWSLQCKIVNTMYRRNQEGSDLVKKLVQSDIPTEFLREHITNEGAKWPLSYFLRVLRNA